MNKDISAHIMLLQNKNTIECLTKCNPYTQQYGLVLSQQEMLMLSQARLQALKHEERLELGEGILPKLIYAFCDSPYIYQENYVETLEGLQNIFYLYKNETMEGLSDDELILYMRDMFNGECQGSLDYLEETCLDRLARDIREGLGGYIGENGYEE